MKDVSFPGDELRKRRQKLKLSIDDVYRKLHIPADFVESIEAGDISALPPMCYAAGFITTYCVLLELEPEKYVDLLRDCVRPAPRFLGIPHSDENRKSPSWLNDIVAWSAICALLVLGWFTYSVTFQPKADRSDRQVEAGSIEEMPTPHTESF